MPPLLAGRDAELILARRLLDQLASGRRPSQDLLFYGPRGNGKTVLLLRIAETARSRLFRVNHFPLSELETRSDLIRQLQGVARLTGTRMTGANVGPFGVATDAGEVERDIGTLFETWIRNEAAPLVIIADEFHAVQPAAGTAFLNAIQATKGHGHPVLLVAAGTPETPARVREMGTHNERGFHTRRIGRLDRSSTNAALAEPARAAGCPITEAALDLLVAESHDYPYFVQLLGSVAWFAAERLDVGKITARAVRAALEDVGDQISSFHGARFMEVGKHDALAALAPIASLMTARNGSVRFAELHATLQRVAREDAGAPSPIRMLETLSDLGVIWEASNDSWEMGIPSFAHYILHRTARSARN